MTNEKILGADAAEVALAGSIARDAASHAAPKRMRRNVLVYISGPMTAKDGRTMEQNTADGVAVYLDLLKRGIPAFSPHLSGAFPSAWSALDHQQWIDYDLAIIDRCDCLLMMDRWKTSKGAILEYEYAVERGIPVVGSVEQLENGIEHGFEPPDYDEADRDPIRSMGRRS